MADKSSESQSAALYPDLNSLEGDNDVLAALIEPPKRQKPPRPPPPRSKSLPAKAIDAVLNDDGMDIPGVDACQEGVICGHGQETGPSTADPVVSIPTPLSAEKVRWFYQEPGKFWQPFSGPDSLSLEVCHSRLVGGELTGDGEGLVQVMGDLFEVDVWERTCRHIYWPDIRDWGVLRGYWYEVIGEKWYPILEEEYRQIEAAHLDLEWRGKVKAAADLVQWAETVGGSKVSSTSQPDGPSKPAKPPGDEVVHKLTLDKYEVMWMSSGEVKKLKKEMSTQLWNKFGTKLGKGASYGSTKLVRGYKEEATNDGKLSPIGHIVFVIHGIGQSWEISCINKSTNDFRAICTQVAKKQFEDKWSSRRVEFIPVEWRTWLSLDKGVLSDITPHGVMKLRTIFNDSVLDVLYYMSPKYGPEIRDGLRFAIHKQYTEFIRRHPLFLSEGGTVSLLAHSLGTVISYDLLLDTCEAREIPHVDIGGFPQQMKEKSPSEKNKTSTEGSSPIELGGRSGVVFKSAVSSPSPQEDEIDLTQSSRDRGDMAARLELEQLKQRVAELEAQLGSRKRPQGLKFNVDHFFALGSPLAVFLMMREHEQLIKRSHGSSESFIPSCVCHRIHNVHHPSDPVAYRLEPLLNPLYAQIKPVRIDSGSKVSKEAVDHAEGTRKKPMLQNTQGKSWFSSFSMFASSTVGSKKSSSPEPVRAKSSEKVADNDKHLRPEERLKERLDFMLRESFAESSYINSLTAHNGYWTSQDCAQYLLLQLYSYKRGY